MEADAFAIFLHSITKVHVSLHLPYMVTHCHSEAPPFRNTATQKPHKLCLNLTLTLNLTPNPNLNPKPNP